MEPITREEALDVLRSAPVAHLAVIAGGDPYITPMSFVMDDETVFFRTMAGRKLDAIKESPAVCIEVSRYSEETGDWVSVIVTGRAELTDDTDIKTAVVSGLLQKYEQVMASPLEVGGTQPLAGLPYVVSVVIDDISGVVSGRGWSHRTRPGRL